MLQKETRSPGAPACSRAPCRPSGRVASSFPAWAGEHPETARHWARSGSDTGTWRGCVPSTGVPAGVDGARERAAGAAGSGQACGLGVLPTETWPLDSRAAAPVGMEGLEPGATDPCRPERVRQRLAWATGFWCGSLWDWKLADRPARPSGGRPGTPSAEGLTGPWVKWESGWGGQGRGDR